MSHRDELPIPDAASCREVQERLAEHAAAGELTSGELTSGELTAGETSGERAALRAHLAACGACSAEAAALGAAADALRRFAAAEAERPVAPTDVGAILAMARVSTRAARDRAEDDAAAPAAPKTQRRWTFPLRIAAGLLALLGLAALFSAEVTADGGAVTIALRLPGTGAPDRGLDPRRAGYDLHDPRRADPELAARDAHAGDASGTTPLDAADERRHELPARHTAGSLWEEMESLVAQRRGRLGPADAAGTQQAVADGMSVIETAVHRAVEDALRPVLVDLAMSLVALEARSSGEMSAVAGELEQRRAQDVQAMFELLAVTRQELQLSQQAVLAAVEARPAW